MSLQFRVLFVAVFGCICMASGCHAMAETTLSSLVQGATDKTTQQLQSTSVSSSSSSTTKSLTAAATAGGNSQGAATATTTASMPRPSNATTAATHTLTTADGNAVPVTGSSAASTVGGSVVTLDVPTYAPAVADGHVDFGSPSPNKRESDSIQRALDMLREKRSPDYGWENDTHMVILAKELSGARDPTDADGHVQQIQELEDLLSVKQMEIEILSMLDKHHVLPRPVNPDKLARYVLALGSLCKDPKRFYGHDLVAALQHHEPTQVFNPNNPNNSNINNNHPNNQQNTTTNKPPQSLSHDSGSAAAAAAAGAASAPGNGNNGNNGNQQQPPSSYQQHPPPPLHQQQSNDRKLLSSQLAVSELQDQEFALTTLAVCSSAAHVRKRQIRRLLDIASGVTDQSVDTIAMVILALRCIVTDHRHRHLQHFVRRPARGLATLQDMRGNFGSLRSTALAMQALQDLEPDPAGAWNRSAASDWILERQRSDGGWYEEPIHDGQEPNVGIGLTADIILALGWKGLGAVRALQCDHVIGETSDNASENGEPKLAAPVGLASSAEESEPRNISYTYTLWLGTNVTEAFSLSLISPKNTSFFRAMTQAADIDPRFGFEAREWPNGHYVHTLAGKKEEPRGYNYWLLYRLPELPDPNSPPGNQLIAPVGVDELMVEENEHYLYWYKKL